MRPTVQHHDTREQSGRIIYLGDVRRRRSGRRRAPDRHYLLALCLVAVVAWTLWLAVFLSLPPARLLTYAAFLAPLWVALAATGSIAAYGLEWKRGYAPSLRACTRRGVLFASVLVVNLAVQAAHRWVLPVGAITVMAVVVVDVAWSRYRPY